MASLNMAIREFRPWQWHSSISIAPLPWEFSFWTWHVVRCTCTNGCRFVNDIRNMREELLLKKQLGCYHLTRLDIKEEECNKRASKCFICLLRIMITIDLPRFQQVMLFRVVTDKALLTVSGSSFEFIYLK